MEHSEFIKLWKEGKLEIDVNRSMALRAAHSKIMPGRYRFANDFWTWVWFLSIPAAFVVMYFYTWWAGLLLLVFITPLISSSTKKSAMQFMIDHALENQDFYLYAVSEGILRIRKKP